jgi:hypothetical protein
MKTTKEFYKGMGAPWTTHKGGNEMFWLNGMCNEVWDANYNEICMGPDMPSSAEIKARERCPGPGSKPWETVKGAILTGWRPVQVHSTSNHGARLYLQMLEDARKEGNLSVEYIKGLRTTLEHAMLVGNTPDVMEGIKKYGIILNVNMGMLFDVEENIKDYGPELEKFAMPVKTWLNQGIRVTFEASGLDFMYSIYALVTRHIPREFASGEKREIVLLPNEGIDRVSALKMGTTWASEYVLGEETIGTLEPGKFADFAVLNKDFFTVPVDQIRSVKPIMTGLGGKIVSDQENIAAK